jgi:hypothetical protein
LWDAVDAVLTTGARSACTSLGAYRAQRSYAASGSSRGSRLLSDAERLAAA